MDSEYSLNVDTQRFCEINHIIVEGQNRDSDGQLIFSASLNTPRGRATRAHDMVGDKATPREAVQDLCDRNSILSPWDIADLKKFLGYIRKKEHEQTD